MLAFGDKANVFAHWQAKGRRRWDVLKSRQENSTGRVPKATDLDDLLEEMRMFLGGERLDAETKRIREEEQEAMRVAVLAGRLQSGTRTAAQAGARLGSAPLDRVVSPRGRLGEHLRHAGREIEALNVPAFALALKGLLNAMVVYEVPNAEEG